MLQFTLPDNSELLLPSGSNLLTIAKLALNVESPIVEATLDGMPIDLQAPLTKGGKVEFIEMNTEEGMRIYLRTLLCVLISTTEKLYPGTKLEVRSTLGSALYIADKSTQPLNYRDWKKVETTMRSYVNAKEPIRFRYVNKEEAIEIACKNGIEDGVAMAKLVEDKELPVYTFLGRDCYMFGSMCPNASYVPLFEVIPYGNGIVLRLDS